jgi:hypothetical protein
MRIMEESACKADASETCAPNQWFRENPFRPADSI